MIKIEATFVPMMIAVRCYAGPPVPLLPLLPSLPAPRLVLLVLSDPLPLQAPTDQTARSDPQLLEVRMVRSGPKIQWVQPVLLVLSDPLPPKAPHGPLGPLGPAAP